MTAANVLLIVAAIAWILARQVRREPIKVRLLVAAPLALGYFGLQAVPPTQWHSPADIALLAAGAVAAGALGLWRGQTITVWREPDGTFWRQGSKATLALWGLLLLARGALLAAAAATGHAEASGPGPILCTLAISFAAQNAVIATRMATAPFATPSVGLATTDAR